MDTKGPVSFSTRDGSLIYQDTAGARSVLMMANYNQRYAAAASGSSSPCAVATAGGGGTARKGSSKPKVPRAAVPGVQPQRIEECIFEEEDGDVKKTTRGGTADPYKYRLQPRACETAQALTDAAHKKKEVTGLAQSYDEYVATLLTADALKRTKAEAAEYPSTADEKAKVELAREQLDYRMQLTWINPVYVCSVLLIGGCIQFYLFANGHWVEKKLSEVIEKIEDSDGEDVQKRKSKKEKEREARKLRGELDRAQAENKKQLELVEKRWQAKFDDAVKQLGRLPEPPEQALMTPKLSEQQSNPDVDPLETGRYPEQLESERAQLNSVLFHMQDLPGEQSGEESPPMGGGAESAELPGRPNAQSSPSAMASPSK